MGIIPVGYFSVATFRGLTSAICEYFMFLWLKREIMRVAIVHSAIVVKWASNNIRG